MTLADQSLLSGPNDSPFSQIYLRGWPGYRTRFGRSGLDYIDTMAEAAHMTGLFLRLLLTGQWRSFSSGVSPWIGLVLGIFLLGAHYSYIPVLLLVSLAGLLNPVETNTT